MGHPVSPSLAQAFYQAYTNRDLAAVLEFLSDDVEWNFLGPVDIFPFCGNRRGKAAVVEHFVRRVPSRFTIRRFDPEEMIIGGESAAAFSKLAAVESGTDRVLTFYCAHFVTFRDDKVVAMQAVADTFSVIEQLSDVSFVFGAPQIDGDLCDTAPFLGRAPITPVHCAADCEQSGCMTAIRNHAPPQVARFYEAIACGDSERLDAVLHDDVTWLLSGPADHIDFFGMRRGKAEVIELFTRILPCFYQLAGYEIQQLVVEGDRVAAFGRVCGLQRETKRTIRFGFAHFMRFQDGKLISMRAIADSFDALEQIKGCRIELMDEAGLVPAFSDSDVMAL